MDWDWKKIWGGVVFVLLISLFRWFGDEPNLTAMQTSLIAIFGAVVTRPSQHTMWQTFKNWRKTIADDANKKHLAKKTETGS